MIHCGTKKSKPQINVRKHLFEDIDKVEKEDV
jgi:hypothetical protein